MDQPTKSPDYLDSPAKRGKGLGIRRLNRTPIVLVIISAVLVITAIIYTVYDRQLAMSPGSVEEGKEIIDVALSPIERPKPPEPPPVPVQSQITSTPSVSPPPDPDAEARLALTRKIQENRFTAYEAAIGAPSGVQSFSSARPEQMALGTKGESQPPSLPAQPFLDPNRQDQKKAFLARKTNEQIYSEYSRVPALAELEIKAGTIIPSTLISGINSDLPGQIVAQVRQNVYDSKTGQHLLIPAASKLIGDYDSSVAYGQERALVAWHRIIYPDASTVLLNTAPGTDPGGYAGFHDKVNNHYWRLYGNAIMVALFSAGMELGTNDSSSVWEDDPKEEAKAEFAQQLGQLGMQMAQRNLDIQPTLEIRPGYRFNVFVTKDIILPPWKGHPMFAGSTP